MTDAGPFLRALARELAPLIALELRAGELPGMVDQVGSPLGRRRHIAAVRRRVGSCRPGAAIVGRRHLLSPEALTEELEALGRKPRKRPAEPEALAAELGLRLIGGVR
jgi:hypothetical protein